MAEEKKKPSLWEQMGRKTQENTEEKKKVEQAVDQKKKEKEAVNIRGTKIYGKK